MNKCKFAYKPKKKMDENNVIQFTEWDGNTCNIIADHINISQKLQKLFIIL